MTVPLTMPLTMPMTLHRPLPLADDFAFPRNIALFLDFDGTLAGFKNDPETVHLSTEQVALLLQVSRSLAGATAIISGRDLRDLSKRIPNKLWRLGNHGLYSAPPGHMPSARFDTFPPDLRESLAASLQKLSGVWIENKGPIIAIHYRAAPDAGPEIDKILAPHIAAQNEHPHDFIIQRGHHVTEVKPAAANKGMALTRQMALPPFAGRTPIMIGDDTTDEDGFIAAAKLGGYGIKMGGGPTQAKYNLPNRPALYKLLGTLV